MESPSLFSIYADEITSHPYLSCSETQREERFEEEVCKLLKKLPNIQREAILVKAGLHPEFNNCRELAKKRGLSHQTIYDQVNKAKQFLEKYIGEN